MGATVRMGAQGVDQPLRGKPNAGPYRVPWWMMFCQWLSVRLLAVYFGLRYRVRVLGKENQPAPMQQPYVVACNHVSLLDPPLLSVAMDFQPIAYMAKRELFRHPLLGAYLHAVGAISVNREKLELSTVRHALNVLKDGRWTLGIFPEGTRQQSGEIRETKRGVAYFAKAAQVPILPVGLAMLGEDGKQVEVRIGKLIPPESDLDALTDKVQQALSDLVIQAQQAS